MINDWKDKLGFVYSTNPEFKINLPEDIERETPPPGKQNLLIAVEKKNRGGKTVTIIKGFIGSEEDLNDFAKKIKTYCGVGGSVKNGDIIIQGNLKIKLAELLNKWGYRIKVSGS